MDAPLLEEGDGNGTREVRKRPSPFGWWPLYQEVIPQDPATAKADRALVIANIVAGMLIGVRQGLSAIMTASLIFTTAGVPELSDMFGFGISMMWYSSTVAALWYGLFGRMQYGLIGINDVVAILWGTMGTQVGIALKDDPSKIPPTQLALIAVSTLMTGAFSIAFGRLGLGKLMLLFPAPVTSGFIGSIGLFIFKSSLQIASGVKFHYLWPDDLEAFCRPQSLGRVCCMFGMLFFMWYAPPILNRAFKNSDMVKKLGGLACQLLPLLFFYVGTSAAGVSMDTLTANGWTYPKQGSGSALALWTTYDLRDADWSFVLSSLPHMGLIVLMSVLCTMLGVLGISAKVPVGPPGDPAPTETIDYNRELVTVGWVDLILGLSGGIITFHRLGSTIQLHMSGGTHRLSVFACAIFCFSLLLSGVPIGHVIPTWFLGALFINSSIAMVKDAMLYFRDLPPSKATFLGQPLPSMQYFVTLACIVVAIAKSPFAGIGTGLVLSVFIFLWQSSESEPVSGLITGNLSVGRTKRPLWELKCLRSKGVGDRVLLLFLQGHLFFGSADRIAKTLATATTGLHTGDMAYCILSFARVIFIDSTAAKQVKASVDKAIRNGCKVLFCRMNEQVFAELWVAGAIKSPDGSMRHLLHAWGIDLQEIATSETTAMAGDAESPPHALPRRMTCAFVPLGSGAHDAFDTETDALDYCNDLLVDKLCYSGDGVEPYMLSYRNACKHGARLSERDFEEMSGLRQGTMEELIQGGYLKSHPSLAHNTSLPRSGKESSLYFIMRGAVAQLHMLSDEELVVADGGKLHAEVKGYSGRGGKRLHCRLTPGHVAGKVSFALGEKGVVDRDTIPTLQVSSRFSGYSDVWELTSEKWRDLQDQKPEVHSSLVQMLLRQLADERQHTYLME